MRLRNIARRWLGALALAVAATGLGAGTAAAQNGTPYTFDQLVDTGNQFFGQVSGNLAAVIEEAISRFGLPNGYILGESVGGALVAGVRYGEGVLYTQNVGNYEVYWQAPDLPVSPSSDEDGFRTAIDMLNFTPGESGTYLLDTVIIEYSDIPAYCAP